jgi:NAD(P)-dependent dehydrogenase (short-subunit alcohol dehydrogenase family)
VNLNEKRVLVTGVFAGLKPGARLVCLSSNGHRFFNVDLDDPNFAHTLYEEWLAYGRSKTANVLFAVEFDRRHKAMGVRATAVHPGAIHTELGRHLTPEVTQRVMDAISATSRVSGEPAFEYKTVPQGSATSVWAGAVARADVWAAAIARTATWRRSSKTRACGGGSADTRSTRKGRERYGSLGTFTNPDGTILSLGLLLEFSARQKGRTPSRSKNP